MSEREERRRATGGGWRVRGGCKCGHAGEVPIKGKINEGEEPYGNQLDYDECLSCQ